MVVPRKVVGVIPARFGSTRFPGKPLVKILGKTLIQRTYENAKLCKTIQHLVVATDDQRIFDHVKEFGGEVVMTSTDCPTGSDRVAEVIKNHSHYADASLVVNIQGDEPCVDPDVIDRIVNALEKAPDAVVSTAVARMKSYEEALIPSIVKCVLDHEGYALYFSRAAIPYQRNKQNNPPYFHHIGVYCFRPEFLMRYITLPQTPLQKAEDLEQLKILEHGFRIKVAEVNDVAIGVDTPEDIIKIEQVLCSRNTYSSPVGSSHR